MSNQVNDELLDKARQIADEYEGTPLADAIRNNVERGNLDIVAELVRQTEEQWLNEAYLERNNAKY